ncbi:U-scoloptoxin(16)-Er13a-like [Pollicipes pollicipes]|uniref:U-scoloptoxin(16)-Er13a-like n=1 Tax=Pollicipes pollicipes TaxID=41117 RepID=UPI0018854DDF|nr:U-scoloptoxin(16)-Er13a-like [Pollicipes pollicipes]
MIKYVLLAACAVHLAAAVHTHQEYFVSPAPGHADECQDNRTGVRSKVGESWTTTGCKQATCVLRENAAGKMQLTIAEDSCPIIAQKPGCRRTAVSRTKKFPHCCPRLQCRKTTGGKVVSVPYRPRK